MSVVKLSQVNHKNKRSQLPSQKLAKRNPQKKRSRLFPESQVQLAVLEWLNLYNPFVRRLVIKIDNEGKRTAAGHLLAVKLGLHIGASDLFIAYPTNLYGGLWLELKREKWKPTKATKEHDKRQDDFLLLMNDNGYYARKGIGVDQSIQIIKDYLSQ